MWSLASRRRVGVALAVLCGALCVAPVVRAQAPDAFGIWFDNQAATDTVRTTGPQLVNAYLILRNGSTPFGICGWEAEIEAVGTGVTDAGWSPTAGVNVATAPRFQVGIPDTQHLPSSPAMVLATGSFWVPDPSASLRLFIHPYAPASLQDPPGSGNPVQAPVFAANWQASDLRAGNWASGHEALPVAVINPPADAAPVCRLSSSAVAFGDLSAGTTRTRRLEIANIGGGVLSGDVPAPDCAEFAVADGGGAYALGPGEVRTVTLRYQPTAAGEHACVLAVCGGVALTGRAFTPGGCRVEPLALEFGSVPWGSRSCQAVTLYNDGAVPLTGTVALTGPFVAEGSPDFAVPAGASMQIGLCFAPGSLGDWTGTATFGGCGTVTLHGVGTEPPPRCVLSQGQLDFGSRQVGDVVELSTTLRNAAGGVLTGEIGVPAVAVCAPYSIVAGVGPFALAHDESLRVTVRYAPTQSGVHDCVLNFGGCSPLYLRGGVPSCLVSVAALDFGSVYAGESATRAVRITNTGGGRLTGTPATLQAPFSLAGTGSYALGPGQSADFNVVFAPTEAGNYAQSLPFPGGCAPVSLTAVGLPAPPPGCNLSPTSLTFADTQVGSSRDGTVTISNSGRGPLAGTIGLTGVGFALMSGGGAFSLTTGQSRLVTIRFTPSARAAYSGTLETGTTACASVPLYGNSPDCAVSPLTLDFGQVLRGSTAERTFTISNPGAGVLTGQVSEACTPYTITSGAGVYTLQSGQSTTITVRFAPTTNGTQNCSVVTGTYCGAVACTGQGISASCSVSPTTLDFGEVQVGQSADRTFTITNPGTIPLDGTVTATCGAFTLTGTTSYHLETGQSATITVHFAPTAAGALSCAVNTGLFCGAVACSGTATSGPALCTVSVDTLRFGRLSVPQTRQLSFTISNPGGSTLSGVVTSSNPVFEVGSWGGPFSLAPGASRQVYVTFAPAEPIDYAGTISLGTSCPGVPCTGSGANGPSDLLGIYFDNHGGTNRVVTTASYTPVTAYLVLSGASEPWGVSGWECCVTIAGNALAPNWTLAGQAVNISTAPCFQVGLTRPLAWNSAIQLASVQFIVPTPADAILFFVGPYTIPSLPGVPVYAAGNDPGRLVPLNVPGYDFAQPVAFVNPSSPVPVLAATPSVACADGAVRLSWRYDQASADGCRVYRRVDDGPAAALPAAPALDGRGGASFTDTAPPAAATLGYSYALLRAGEEIARSAEVTTTCAGPPPSATLLHPVFPNPFNPQATVRFDLARAGRARVTVFDLAGRRVRTLCDEDLPAGAHSRVWDGRDDAGQPLPSGTYYARLAADGGQSLRKMALVR